MNVRKHRLDPWTKIMPAFEYDSEVPFFEMLVPTSDTVRFGFVMERLIYADYPVMYTGDTGTFFSIFIVLRLIHILFRRCRKIGNR